MLIIVKSWLIYVIYYKFEFINCLSIIFNIFTKTNVKEKRRYCYRVSSKKCLSRSTLSSNESKSYSIIKS